MRAMRSDYMHWAKFKPPVRFPLTSSEVPHFRMDSLPLDLADLDLDGASHPRYPPLRAAIARRYGVTPEQVVAADGTSMANFLALAGLIAPGDAVLVERPTYEPLLGAAGFLGADVRRFERRADDGFRLDVDRIAAAAGANTRLIVITNLHNPSSALADEADLLALRDLAQRLDARSAAAAGATPPLIENTNHPNPRRARGDHPDILTVRQLAQRLDARILVDEVYLDSAVPPRRSAAHLGPEFVCTNSLTKVYGLSGLRCGWILAEPGLAERMWRLNDLFGVNQAHQAERLACLAFDRLDDILGDTPAMLERNRARFNAFVEARADLECMAAEHGIVAFPRWLGGDSDALADRLRERYDTAVVPGRWFEMPDHFRVGLGVPGDVLDEGLDRLGAALDDLQ